MQSFLDIFDIYLLEAVINGILLGGVLALLALGLNLIFGVIDVTWICYAELVMIGMYGMYYLVQYYGLPYWAAAPLVINVCNFAKGADGAPSLLSPDDARTLFHEFGHGLHGMLSNVTYPSLSGTSVFTDFVELPSQLYEHWQERPEVLQRFARHYQTGEALPDDLLKRFLAARKFNQGFATVEFVSSALVDLEFHTQPAAASWDVRAFEQKELEKIGMPAEISLRHRPTQFGHIFSGDHYASGYYSYMWSEVMDADAFGAFEEAGDIFDPATAKRLHDDIYSSGGSRDPEEAYVAFRGREPEPDALLRRRGLLETPEAA